MMSVLIPLLVFAAIAAYLFRHDIYIAYKRNQASRAGKKAEAASASANSGCARYYVQLKAFYERQIAAAQARRDKHPGRFT